MERTQVEAMGIGPSLGDRIRKQRRIETQYLKWFRESLEQELEGDWTAVELPAALMLADVCAALCLSETQQREVLGEAGWELVTATHGERFKTT
jgi:hypothetical protein